MKTTLILSIAFLQSKCLFSFSTFDWEQRYKEDITEFQCPPINPNKLGENVCSLGDSVEKIDKAIDTLTSENSKQTGQIDKNAQDISNLLVADTNLDSRIDDLLKKVEQLATCRKSAAHYLGIPNGGRYVGNCNTGAAFTTSVCILQCQDLNDGGNYHNCASLQCDGADRWKVTSGQVCCKVNQYSGPEGCC